ncbi:hypothetical protein Q31a_45910 [Aureliella helgolandensis]|uniref:Uncharacterized protein n=1 Tax=Aureliella helgolandensis TaxID=2527968 RepID=A0A518GC98_9BACT|nr:hypothetical protein Q31a_45910 [Aureliella helgolandensis]
MKCHWDSVTLIRPCAFKILFTRRPGSDSEFNTPPVLGRVELGLPRATDGLLEPLVPVAFRRSGQRLRGIMMAG